MSWVGYCEEQYIRATSVLSILAAVVTGSVMGGVRYVQGDKLYSARSDVQYSLTCGLQRERFGRVMYTKPGGWNEMFSLYYNILVSPCGRVEQIRPPLYLLQRPEVTHAQGTFCKTLIDMGSDVRIKWIRSHQRNFAYLSSCCICKTSTLSFTELVLSQ